MDNQSQNDNQSEKSEKSGEYDLENNEQIQKDSEESENSVNMDHFQEMDDDLDLEQEKIVEKVVNYSDDDEDYKEIQYEKNVNDEENYSLEGEDDKKKKTKRQKRLQKNSKKRVTDPQYDIGVNQDPDNNQGQDDYVTSLIKKAMPKGGSTRHKKLTDDELKEEKAYYDEMVGNFINKMEQAYYTDIELNQKQQPAVKKIILIQQLQANLQMLTFQHHFLELNGLNTLQKWVEKTHNGMKPSQTLKQKMLDILNNLQLDEFQITGTTLGKFLNSIYENQSENREMRKLAKQIMDKWSRILLGNQVNYRSLEMEIAEEEVIHKKRRQIPQQPTMDLFNKEQTTKYVKLPQQKQYEFYVNAKSKVNRNNVEMSDKSKEIFNQLVKLKRENIRKK